VSVFQVHAIDAQGNVIVRRQLRRGRVLEFFEKLPPCLIGIEACASSHHWSRELQRLGHTVRLMPPAKLFTPVALPPGRARLATSPSAIGSAAAEKTIGIVSSQPSPPVPTACWLRQSRPPDGAPDRPPAPASDRIGPRPSGIRSSRLRT
jgi:hypothetical protein